ncbi:MAG: hypothetical protein FWC46_08070 [Actinomycetia bacterium]|nr:hypothetical protein [Actinomycetes bacterium]
MSPHRVPGKLTWAAATLVVVALPWLSSCASGQYGTLDPGGLDGGYVAQMPRSPDGRPNGFGVILTNGSQTGSAALVSVSLIGAHGLEIVDADTLSRDHAITGGGWIPPLPQDDENDAAPQGWPDMPANWETRVALNQSVVEPGQERQLIIVVQATSQDDCLYAEGFTLRYREFGRLFSVDSDGAPMIYYYHPETDLNQCDAIVKQILANQASRRSG